MELKSFISQSIKDIFDGVLDAQEYAKEKGGKVNVYQCDCIRMIEFDIAVSAHKSQEISGGADVKIYVVDLDIDGKITKDQSTVSRLKFIIPVELPNREWVDKTYREAIVV